MASEDHLRLIKRGVGPWNAWRQQNSGVRPDLSSANLRGADLRGAFLAEADLVQANLNSASLTGATLYEAHLSDADLSGADLAGANLDGASLTDADLRDADLSGAHLAAALDGAKLTGANLAAARLESASLTDADLTDANLIGAHLINANLYGAILTGADLTNVELGETVLADVDLSGTKGLDTCIHWRSSIIDHRTFQLSGLLPLSFLRGCGLPDNLIEYLPSLLNQPIQFYSCFISYSSQDDDFARRLHADLQDNGIRCWFAPEDMKIGDRIRTRIDEVIRLHEKLLLVLSANSIDSDWVEKEVETAFEKERETKGHVLFPVRLDDAVMESKTGWAADIRRTHHIGDFRRWKDHDGYRETFERLLRDLKVGPAG